MHTHTYVRMHAHTHTHTHIHIRTLHTRTHTRTHAYTHAHAHTRTYRSILIVTVRCTFTYRGVYRYYIQKYLHIYSCTHCIYSYTLDICTQSIPASMYAYLRTSKHTDTYMVHSCMYI